MLLKAALQKLVNESQDDWDQLRKDGKLDVVKDAQWEN